MSHADRSFDSDGNCVALRVQPVCVAARANAKSKQPAKMNIGFVNLFVASGEACNRSNKIVKKEPEFPEGQGRGLVAKNVSVSQRPPSMQPVNDIHDLLCDFPCCSQTKCIRTICGIQLGQPQPHLLLWES